MGSPRYLHVHSSWFNISWTPYCHNLYAGFSLSMQQWSPCFLIRTAVESILTGIRRLLCRGCPAECTIGTTLPTLQDLYSRRCGTRACRTCTPGGVEPEPAGPVLQEVWNQSLQDLYSRRCGTRACRTCTHRRCGTRACRTCTPGGVEPEPAGPVLQEVWNQSLQDHEGSSPPTTTCSNCCGQASASTVGGNSRRDGIRQGRERADK